ncbi:MAG TPA: hypothetical protein VLV15_02055 [Dongiaceae bacterium]|nr:hypothetical protein [Dongiaceae bacterium]
MRHVPKLLATVPLALAVALVAGCGKSGSTLSPAAGGDTGSVDQIQVSEAIAAHPEVLDDGGLSSDPTQTSLSTGGGATPASIEAPIQPLFFWRHITRTDRSFEFAFSDTDSTGRPTRAIVTALRNFGGQFNVVVGDSNSFGGGNVIHKNLVDHWVRRIELRRMRLTATGDPVWKIVAASAVRITSKDATAHIQSIQVETAGLDTTLTAPLELFRLRGLLRFAPDTPVTITVTTTHDNDVVLLYSANRRMRFKNNGDGTYVGTWSTPDLAGLRHVGINALTHGTLYDDSAPYDSQAWMLPFVVTGHELADYLP